MELDKPPGYVVVMARPRLTKGLPQQDLTCRIMNRTFPLSTFLLSIGILHPSLSGLLTLGWDV